MATVDVTTARWFTASYTIRNGACVEVADVAAQGHWAVRDSKDRTGPVLVVPTGQWASFVDDVRTGGLTS